MQHHIDAGLLRPVRLIGDLPFLIDDEDHIRHPAVGMNNRFVQIVDEDGYLHPELLDKLFRVAELMFVRGVLGVFFEIPPLPRVRLFRVNDEKFNAFILVFLSKLF